MVLIRIMIIFFFSWSLKFSSLILNVYCYCAIFFERIHYPHKDLCYSKRNKETWHHRAFIFVPCAYRSLGHSHKLIQRVENPITESTTSNLISKIRMNRNKSHLPHYDPLYTQKLGLGKL